jgi:hypothetical protein
MFLVEERVKSGLDTNPERLIPELFSATETR